MRPNSQSKAPFGVLTTWAPIKLNFGAANYFGPPLLRQQSNHMEKRRNRTDIKDNEWVMYHARGNVWTDGSQPHYFYFHMPPSAEHHPMPAQPNDSPSDDAMDLCVKQ